MKAFKIYKSVWKKDTPMPFFILYILVHKL